MEISGELIGGANREPSPWSHPFGCTEACLPEREREVARYCAFGVREGKVGVVIKMLYNIVYEYPSMAFAVYVDRVIHPGGLRERADASLSNPYENT